MIKSVKASLLAAASIALIGAGTHQVASAQGMPSLKTASYMTPEQLSAAYANATPGGIAGTYNYANTSVANSVGYQPASASIATYGAGMASTPSLKSITATSQYVPTPAPQYTQYGTVQNFSPTLATPTVATPVIVETAPVAEVVELPVVEVVPPITTPAPRTGGNFYAGVDFGASLHSGISEDSYSDIRLYLASPATEVGGPGLYSNRGQDLGYFGSLRAGYMTDLGAYFGVEGTYRTAAIDVGDTWLWNNNNLVFGNMAVDGTVNSLAGFVVGGFSMPVNDRIRPYAEVLAGWSLNTVDASASLNGGPAVDFEELPHHGFAYGAGIGVGYRISDNLELRGGYRYRNYSVARTGNTSPGGIRMEVGTLDNHELNVGLGFFF